MGSLLSIDGEWPKFVYIYIYIYDTKHDVHNRIRVFNLDGGNLEIDEEIVKELIMLFDIENQIIKTFRMPRDHFKESDFLLV